MDVLTVDAPRGRSRLFVGLLVTLLMFLLLLLTCSTYLAVVNVQKNRSSSAAARQRNVELEGQKKDYLHRILTLEAEVSEERRQNSDRDKLIVTALMRIDNRIRELTRVDETITQLDSTELTDLLNSIAATRGL
jgi:hypothetical protein